MDYELINKKNINILWYRTKREERDRKRREKKKLIFMLLPGAYTAVIARQNRI